MPDTSRRGPAADMSERERPDLDRVRETMREEEREIDEADQDEDSDEPSEEE